MGEARYIKHLLKKDIVPKPSPNSGDVRRARSSGSRDSDMGGDPFDFGVWALNQGSAKNSSRGQR